MAKKQRFIPVQGTEAQIDATPKHPGYVYVATDTGHMYLDINETETGRIAIGGDSGGGGGTPVLYAKAKPQLTGDGNYTIQRTELEDKTVIVKVDDLILNDDGSFYRVLSIEDDVLTCLRIATGGGGAPDSKATPTKLTLLNDISGSTFINGQSQKLRFIATSATDALGNPLDKKIAVKWTLTYEKVVYHSDTIWADSGKETEIDFGKIARKDSTSEIVLVATQDNYQTTTPAIQRATFKTTDLALKTGSSFSNVALFNCDNVKLNLNIIGNLDKVVDIYWDDVLIASPVYYASSNTSQTINLVDYINQAPDFPNGITHGVHKVKFELFQLLNEDKNIRGVSAPALSFEIATKKANDTTPIIWLGDYKETYYEYDVIQIPFRVYDPLNTSEALVYFYKNNILIEDEPRTITDNSNFSIFEIAEGDLGMVNYYTIKCRDTKREISFIVEKDSTRPDFHIQKKDSLILSFEAKGRSNTESKTQRSNWSYTNQKGQVCKAEFTNFNWYNNGWMTDEKKNTVLRISNGAEFTIPLEPMQFMGQSTDKESNSFELQFKIRNVQRYTNLITDITRYHNDTAVKVKEDGQEDKVVSLYDLFENKQSELGVNYSNYDAFLAWYLRTYYVINPKNVNSRLTYDDLEYESTFKKINLSNVVCGFYSSNQASSVVGLCLGPQDAFFSDGTDTVSVGYVEDQIINLSAVYSKASNLIYIYINGVVSGVIKNSKNEPFLINNTKLVFNSKYCDIDLYKIRVYNTDLDVNDIVMNYAVDHRNTDTYDQNNLALQNPAIGEYQFSYSEMLRYNTGHPDAPLMPYVVFDTTASDNENRLPWSKKTKVKVGIEFVNTGLERAYASGELEKLAATSNMSQEEKDAAVKKYYQHHCPSWKGENIDFSVQGTSSEFYPRRNYKAKTKVKNSETGKKQVQIFLNRGPWADDYEHNREKTRQKFFYYNNNTVGTTKFTFKVDFMESSGSYNMGFANLVGNAYSKHPLKDYNDKEVFQTEGGQTLTIENLSDYRTSVQGFRVLAFHKKSETDYQFIGIYNMLLDKGADEAYGFAPMQKGNQKYVENKPIEEVAECWEFENNNRTFCSFRDPLNRRQLSFNVPDQLTAAEAPIVADSFEYRYNNNADEIDYLVDLKSSIENTSAIAKIQEKFGVDISKSSKDGPENGRKLLLKLYGNWEKAVQWVWSTNTDAVISQNTYKEATDVGANVWEAGKYYVYKDGKYELDQGTSWNNKITYYNKVKEDEYVNAFINRRKYSPNEYYTKVSEDEYVLCTDSSFDSSLTYYDGETLADSELEAKADPIVELDTKGFVAGTAYYRYLESVTENKEKAYEKVENVTAENYSNEPRYVAITKQYGDTTYKYDTKEYRAAKFRNELKDHFDIEYLATYFVMTEVFECYDSRGKNCMMASWGPLEKGGDYIWYPIFYDIDTQLGINNTGIPSFEYNVDATEDKNFSTSDSVLWNNFYKYFKNSYITEKYKHLKGNTINIKGWDELKYPPLTSVDRIEKWYLTDPDECNSIAMRGVRPLVATNLDEWYKYITITNNKPEAVANGVVGYLNGNGVYAVDDGNYFYALQGNRSLSRQQFLTNRLDYIDSWLGLGNYARGGSNNMHGRISANTGGNLVENPVTSDEWVVDAENPYFDENGNKNHEFDAEWWINLTPIRSSYVTIQDDNEVYPSKKYDGITPVKFEATALKSGVMSSAPYAEQLFYVYGIDKMAEVGDMSPLYWQEFFIEGNAKHLTKLLLGYDGVDKNNKKWFNKKVNAPSIPAGKRSTGMPLLKEINLSNLTITLTSPTIDLSSCEKLEICKAAGSNYTGITFAEGVSLNTLYLPQTITSLSLTEANLLTTLLEKVTPPSKTTGAVSEKGLYIEGLFGAENVTNLNSIELIGGGLGFDSYKLLKRWFYIVDKNIDASSALYKVKLTDVSWSPYVKLVEGDTYNAEEASKYYVDNGHYGFAKYVYNAETFNTQLLNGELYKEDDTLAEKALQINDDCIAMLKKFISNEHYTTTTYSEDKRAYPEITGIVYVNNETSIDEADVYNTLQKAYPNLTFFFKNVNKGYSAKFIQLNNDGTYKLLGVQKIGADNYQTESFIDPLDAYKGQYENLVPNYDFYGWTNNAEVSTPDKVEKISASNKTWYKKENGYLLNTTTNTIAVPENDQYNTWIDEHGNPTAVGKPSAGIYDYTFYAVYGIHKYEMTWMDGDGTTVLTTTAVPYGQAIEEPLAYPYKDDSKLDREKTYKFIGWSLMQNGNPIKLKSYQATRDYTFYSSFTESSVYDNVANTRYFNIYQGELSPRSGIVLKGKITLPAKVNNEKVTVIKDFKNQKEITGIFFEKSNVLGIERFEQNAFQDCHNLRYLEYPKSLTRIESGAVLSCYSLQDYDLTNASELQYIGENAFAYSGDTYNPVQTKVELTIKIPASVKKIAQGAFKNNGMEIAKREFYGAKYTNQQYANESVTLLAFNNVTIGAPSSPSQLTSIGENVFNGGDAISNPKAHVRVYAQDPISMNDILEPIKGTDAEAIEIETIEAFAQ